MGNGLILIVIQHGIYGLQACTFSIRNIFFEKLFFLWRRIEQIKN
jgi:hypothetical protein